MTVETAWKRTLFVSAAFFSALSFAANIDSAQVVLVTGQGEVTNFAEDSRKLLFDASVATLGTILMLVLASVKDSRNRTSTLVGWLILPCSALLVLHATSNFPTQVTGFSLVALGTLCVFWIISFVGSKFDHATPQTRANTSAKDWFGVFLFVSALAFTILLLCSTFQSANTLVTVTGNTSLDPIVFAKTLAFEAVIGLWGGLLFSLIGFIDVPGWRIFFLTIWLAAAAIFVVWVINEGGKPIDIGTLIWLTGILISATFIVSAWINFLRLRQI